MQAARLAPFASLVLMACAASAPPGPATPVHVTSAPPAAFRDSARRTKIAMATTKLDAFFAEVVKKEQLPGLAVGLVADGDLVWSKGYGVKDVTTNAPVDADTVFRIGSITKTFTAVAALQLRDAGRLSLDAPAAKWLPELDEVVYASSDSPPITMRGLLTHTSGLPRLGAFSYTDPKRPPTEQEIASSLRGLTMSRAAGTREEYSNLGFGLAGIVVGHAAGVPYRDYVSRWLLAPLGMSSTVWEPTAVPADRLATAYARGPNGALERREPWALGASEGAGGLYSTVRDMARWTAMHLQAEPPRDDGDPWPVKRATLREAMTTQFLGSVDVVQRSPVRARADGMGLGWETTDDCELHIVEKSGGTEGYKAFVAMEPDRGVAVVLLANLFGANLGEPAEDALRLVAREASLEPRAIEPGPALVGARDRVLALYDRWDDAEAQRLFFPELVDEVGGVGKMRDKRDAIFAKVGACSRVDGRMNVVSQTAASWRFVCEKGAIEADMTLRGSPPRIASLSFDEVIAPGDGLAKVADRVASLSAKWDDGAYEELLYPTFDKEEMRQFFAGVAHDAGTCKVDRAIAGDGTTQGKWRLACAKAPLDLELTVDPKNGRVGRMLVVPAHDARSARCSR